MTFRSDTIQKKKQGSCIKAIKAGINQGNSNNSCSLHSDPWQFSKCVGQLDTRTVTRVIGNESEESTPLRECPKDYSDYINNEANLRPLNPSAPIVYPTHAPPDDELDKLEHKVNANTKLGGGSWAALWRQQTRYTEWHSLDLNNNSVNIEDPELRYQMGLLSIAGSCIQSFTHSSRRQTNPNLSNLTQFPLVQKKPTENGKRQQGNRSSNSVPPFGAKVDCLETFTAKRTSSSNNAVICVVGRQQKFSDISKPQNLLGSTMKTVGCTMLPILRNTPVKKTADSPSQFTDPMRGANGTFRCRIQTLLYLEETTKRWERSKWRRKMKRRRSLNANRVSN